LNVACYRCKKLYNAILERCPHCNVDRHEVYEVGKEMGKALKEFGLAMYERGKIDERKSSQ